MPLKFTLVHEGAGGEARGSQGGNGNLVRLSLDRSGLTRLPDDFASLQVVSALSLDGNALATLPPPLLALHNLVELSARNNRIGSVPAEIGVLNALEVLNLAGNQISDVPPPLCALPSLRKLDLSANRIGALPREIGLLRSLEELHLQRNAAMGATQRVELRSARSPQRPEGLAGRPPRSPVIASFLPDEMAKCTALAVLSLAHCDLHAVPRALFLLPSLRHLDLAGNELERLDGDDDAWLGWQRLESLDLSENALATLPPAIGSLASLHSLNVARNPLGSGAGLPSSMCEMRALKSLNLAACGLTAVPDVLTALTGLVSLSVAGNPALGGDGGAALAFPQLLALEHLDLSDTGLHAPPPGIWEPHGPPHAALVTLVMHRNALASPLAPPSPQALPALRFLGIASCTLTQLSPGWGTLGALEALDVSGNALRLLPPGTPPLSPALVSLDLSNNPLQALPPSLPFLEHLREIVLDGVPLLPASVGTQGPAAVIEHLRAGAAAAPSGSDVAYAQAYAQAFPTRISEPVTPARVVVPVPAAADADDNDDDDDYYAASSASSVSFEMDPPTPQARHPVASASSSLATTPEAAVDVRRVLYTPAAPPPHPPPPATLVSVSRTDGGGGVIPPEEQVVALESRRTSNVPGTRFTKSDVVAAEAPKTPASGVRSQVADVPSPVIPNLRGVGHAEVHTRHDDLVAARPAGPANEPAPVAPRVPVLDLSKLDDGALGQDPVMAVEQPAAPHQDQYPPHGQGPDMAPFPPQGPFPPPPQPQYAPPPQYPPPQYAPQEQYPPPQYAPQEQHPPPQQYAPQQYAPPPQYPPQGGQGYAPPAPAYQEQRRPSHQGSYPPTEHYVQQEPRMPPPDHFQAMYAPPQHYAQAPDPFQEQRRPSQQGPPMYAPPQHYVQEQPPPPSMVVGSNISPPSTMRVAPKETHAHAAPPSRPAPSRPAAPEQPRAAAPPHAAGIPSTGPPLLGERVLDFSTTRALK